MSEFLNLSVQDRTNWCPRPSSLCLHNRWWQLRWPVFIKRKKNWLERKRSPTLTPNGEVVCWWWIVTVAIWGTECQSLYSLLRRYHGMQISQEGGYGLPVSSIIAFLHPSLERAHQCTSYWPWSRNTGHCRASRPPLSPIHTDVHNHIYWW